MKTPLYWGGMILSSIDSAYAYEDWLAALLTRRMALFEDRSTFWGRNRGLLITLCNKRRYPASAFHTPPQDPLVAIPVVDHRIMLLKRRHLNRLRQDLMKVKRRGLTIW